MTTIFTIGHGSKRVEHLIDRLDVHGVRVLVDVRTSPRSRFCPWYNAAAVEAALAEAGLEYVSAGKVLGGLGNRSVHDPLFVEKLEMIRARAGQHGVAMMCAESQPKACHRAYKLSAWLLWKHPDDTVIQHILPDGTLVDGRAFQTLQKPGWVWPELAAPGSAPLAGPAQQSLF